MYEVLKLRQAEGVPLTLEHKYFVTIAEGRQKEKTPK